MPKDPDNPTFHETMEFLRANPEYLKSIQRFFKGGRDGALHQVINEGGSHHGDMKRMAIAGLYSQLIETFS